MKLFFRIRPTFWTGRTGRQINSLAKSDSARILAAYLFSGPAANPFGLYEMPLEDAGRHTNQTIETLKEALAALQDLEFAGYDEETQFVWVYEMAEEQLNLPLRSNDWKCIWAINWWRSLEENPFIGPFFERYRESLLLPERKPLPRGFQGASKGLKGLTRGLEGTTVTVTESVTVTGSEPATVSESVSESVLGGPGGKQKPGATRNSLEVLAAQWGLIIAAAQKWMAPPMVVYLETCKLVRIDRKKHYYVLWCPNESVKKRVQEHVAELRKIARQNGVDVTRFVFQEAAHPQDRVVSR